MPSGFGSVLDVRVRDHRVPAGRSANATGVQAIASQESIDRIGDDTQPDARYSVYFADGPFAYEVSMFGPPDEISRQ